MLFLLVPIVITRLRPNWCKVNYNNLLFLKEINLAAEF
jgi:hypothetical protein